VAQQRVLHIICRARVCARACVLRVRVCVCVCVCVRFREIKRHTRQRVGVLRPRALRLRAFSRRLWAALSVASAAALMSPSMSAPCVEARPGPSSDASPLPPPSRGSCSRSSTAFTTCTDRRARN
jgi:hypothetical protein